MNPDELDLNLLRVLQLLHTEGRVSRVAERLGVTQPAVSNALARLRRQFDDELFVRTPQGMRPTPRAEAMAARVAQALALLQGAATERALFDPATAQRRFTVGMTDIGEIVFLPPLLARLASAAPQVTLSTVRNTAVNLAEAMDSGAVDLAIGLLPQLRGGFRQRRLFTQRYVCLYRQGHPQARALRTLDGFAAAEHVVVVSAGTGHGQVDDRLARAGIARRVRLTVPHFVAVGHILATTDLVATVPQRLAERMAGPFGLQWTPHPAPLPEVAITLFWHARSHGDAASQWLRGELVRLFAHPGGPG
jgi:DNA-binding transcriptional LysR family regulator